MILPNAHFVSTCSTVFYCPQKGEGPCNPILQNFPTRTPLRNNSTFICKSTIGYFRSKKARRLYNNKSRLTSATDCDNATMTQSPPIYTCSYVWEAHSEHTCMFIGAEKKSRKNGRVDDNGFAHIALSRYLSVSNYWGIVGSVLFTVAF